MRNILTAATIATTMTFGAALLAPTLALAYTSKEDCESYEGVGNCKNCPQGAGDPGWHKKSVCNSLVVAPPSSTVLTHKLPQSTTDGKAVNKQALPSTQPQK